MFNNHPRKFYVAVDPVGGGGAGKKDIYFNGRIYVGCIDSNPMDKGFAKNIFVSHPVHGPHSFKDGENVTGLYGLKEVDNSLGMDESSLVTVALPIPERGITIKTAPDSMGDGKAEEKARELVDKFRGGVSESDFHVPEFISGVAMTDTKYAVVYAEEEISLAKACALICVDEIIKTGMMLTEDAAFFSNCNENQTEQYWQSVRNAIQNL